MSSKYGNKSNTSSGGAKKSSYAKLLDVRQVETKNGPAMKLVLAKGVKLVLDGKEVDLGEYNSAFLQDSESIVSRLDKLVEDGKLGADYVESQKQYLQEKNIVSVLEVKRT